MNIETFINFSTYFIIYSILGWILESVFKSILFKKFVNSGFLHGPFCPIYGTGALIMLLCLTWAENNIILLFFMSVIVLTIWEYVVGIILEKLFNTKYWDYSDNKFNFQGRICLQNSIYWGILGVLFVRYIHPFITTRILNVQYNTLTYFNILIWILLIVDLIVCIVRQNTYEDNLKRIKEISDTIKEKIQELKDVSSEKISKEKINIIIEDLNKKQARIKRKMYRHIIRLKKAFPTMKSDRLNNILKSLKMDKEKKNNKK